MTDNAHSNKEQIRLDDIDTTLSVELPQEHIARTSFQVHSFSDASPSLFLILLCITDLLMIILVLIILIRCYRSYTVRSNIPNNHDELRRVFCMGYSHQPVAPTLPSSYSFSNPHEYQQISSQHFHAYLNSFPSPTSDMKELNPDLFLDFHSISSDTSSENILDTSASGYQATNIRGNQRKDRRSNIIVKRWSEPYFLMHEQYMSRNLPQFRQTIMQQQSCLFTVNDSHNSSGIVIDQILQSMNRSTEEDDYDDSYFYHVHQNQIFQNIQEEKPDIIQSHPLHYKEPYFFN